MSEVTKEFKQQLCDRFTSAELADFLQISVEDFCEMFEDELEYNYDDLAEFIGLGAMAKGSSRWPGTGRNEYDQVDEERYSDYT